MIERMRADESGRERERERKKTFCTFLLPSLQIFVFTSRDRFYNRFPITVLKGLSPSVVVLALASGARTQEVVGSNPID